MLDVVCQASFNCGSSTKTTVNFSLGEYTTLNLAFFAYSDSGFTVEKALKVV